MPRVKRAVPPRNIMSNVLKVLDLLVKSMKPIGKRRKKYQDAYSRVVSEEVHCTGMKTHQRECIDLIIKALQSHRYEEAAKLLWIICHDRTVFEPFLYKAVMLVIENLIPSEENPTVWKLFSDAQNLDHVNKREVQLDYIIYGLKNNIPDLQRAAQELISRKKKQYLRKNLVLDPILDVYCSFLDYLEWEKSSCGEIMASQGKSAADKAIDIFKDIIEQPGPWDMFVLKLIEMLEFYERHDEIESLLVKYAKQNPSHINAYIYLSVYLFEHNSDSENLVYALETLAELCPSDIRVLLLVEKWKNIEEKSEICLKYLFMFLDYPCNGRNVQAWKMLTEIIMIFFLRHGNVSDEVKLLWNERLNCWPWIHFNPSHLNSVSEKDSILLAYKIKVLSIFDSGHIYVTKVLEKVPILKPVTMAPSFDSFKWTMQHIKRVM